jgi:hypothetical protein
MRRLLLVALPLPLVALVACGSEPKVTVSALGAAAAATSRAETARFTIDVSSPIGHAEGAFIGRLDGTEAEGTVGVLGRDVPVKVVDGTVYVQLPFLPAATPWLGLSGGGQFPGAGQATVTDALDATQLLDALRQVGDVHEVGHEDIDGTSTTHYAAQIDAQRASGALPNAGALAGKTVPADVWVDGDGLVRRVHVTASGTSGPAVEAQLDITDLGVPVDVVAPPADQVVKHG